MFTYMVNVGKLNSTLFVVSHAPLILCMGIIQVEELNAIFFHFHLFSYDAMEMNKYIDLLM
jgi:hypothetical protein